MGLCRVLFDLASSAFSHDFFGGRHDHFASISSFSLWHGHVVDIIRVILTLNGLRLHAKAGLLLILQHRFYELAHYCSLLGTHLLDLNLEFLFVLSHFVHLDFKFVTLLVKLRLLSEVQLLNELSLILTLSKFLLERYTGCTGFKLLLILIL